MQTGRAELPEDKTLQPAACQRISVHELELFTAIPGTSMSFPARSHCLPYFFPYPDFIRPTLSTYMFKHACRLQIHADSSNLLLVVYWSLWFSFAFENVCKSLSFLFLLWISPNTRTGPSFPIMWVKGWFAEVSWLKMWIKEWDHPSALPLKKGRKYREVCLLLKSQASSFSSLEIQSMNRESLNSKGSGFIAAWRSWQA